MAEQQGFMERHHFLLRRLHSLSGIVPIGVFLIVHLTTNASVIWGAANGRAAPYAADAAGRGVATFQHEVNFINNLPLLLLIEVFGLWLPIAFHVILGIVYAMTGSKNTQTYAYTGNKRYLLQRLSGYVGVLFIFYHVASLRWGWTFLVPNGTEWSHHFAASTLAAALKGEAGMWTTPGVIVSAFYFVGVSLLVYHFANGLWTAAITWGITVSEAAQKRWGHVCTAVGVVLMAAAWTALGGFLFAVDYDQARAVEEQIFIEHHGEEELQKFMENPVDEQAAATIHKAEPGDG
ncbi:MAG TPA: succinate dehydrogenase [Phycisphaerales bacterium]|nr:succinate dehydrogenase [Phycisphaerales bacterium]